MMLFKFNLEITTQLHFSSQLISQLFNAVYSYKFRRKVPKLSTRWFKYDKD